MNTKTTNENLVKNSIQPQIDEFYKEMSNGKVFNLLQVLDYKWCKNTMSNREMFDYITSFGDYIIWEFGDEDEPIEDLYRTTDIENEIIEFKTNDNRTFDDKEEFTDQLFYEYKDKLEDFFTQNKIDSLSEIDICKISKYYVGLEGELKIDRYDNYLNMIEINLLYKIEYDLK